MPFKDTPLTEEEWQALDPARHQIRDSCGRLWDVIKNVGQTLDGYEIIARCPGFRPSYLIMTSKLGGRKIVDKDLFVSGSFHDKRVEVIERDA